MTAKNSHDDNDNDEVQLDVRKLNIPAFMIFGIVGFFIWITWLANNERNELANRLSTIENKLLITHDTIKDLHNKNKTEYQNGENNPYVSKYDFRIWCLETQLMNNSWKCSSIYSIPGNPSIMNKLSDTDLIRESEKYRPGSTLTITPP